MSKQKSFKFVRLTPHSEGGISVFHLFGGASEEVFRAIFEPVSGFPDPSGKLSFGYFTVNGERVDEIVARVIPEEEGEFPFRVFELNLHSGPAIIHKCQSVLEGKGGGRIEMEGYLDSLRDRGRIDDLQRDALEVLLSVHQPGAAALFLSAYRGGFSEQIVRVIEALEGGDFDEETIREVTEELRELSRLYPTGHAFVQPPVLGLTGPSNVGKSTLLNHFAQKEKALVHEEPGTTRDLVRSGVTIEDVPFRIVDTAGLRDTGDRIEAEGIDRAIESLSEVDLLLWMESRDVEGADPPEAFSELSNLRVLNKEDLQEAPTYGRDDSGRIRISALEGRGIEELKEGIFNELGLRRTLPDQQAVPFLPEHRERIDGALNAIQEGDFQGARRCLEELLR